MTGPGATALISCSTLIKTEAPSTIAAGSGARGGGGTEGRAAEKEVKNQIHIGGVGLGR